VVGRGTARQIASSARWGQRNLLYVIIMGVDDTVYLDYPGDRVAAMVIGGMTVVERILREAASAGAVHAVIRGDGCQLPVLPRLPIEVTIVPGASPVPAQARAVRGDVIANVRVRDDDSRRLASRALFQACRRPYDGIGDRYVIRSISLRLTSVMCRLRLTPNQVTTVNILIGLVACGFAGPLGGTRQAFAIAGALMFLQIVLDSCDGELARIRHLGSRFGMWLDNTSDDLIDNLFIAMLGVGLGGIWLPIGIAAAGARSACAIMIHISVARLGKPGDIMAFKWFFDEADEALSERFETGTSVLGVLRAVGRRDLYVLLWSACCLVGLPVVALVLGVAISAIYFTLSVAHLVVTRGR
jgi:phosphatidylglycerophosphate synthase